MFKYYSVVICCFIGITIGFPQDFFADSPNYDYIDDPLTLQLQANLNQQQLQPQNRIISANQQPNAFIDDVPQLPQRNNIRVKVPNRRQNPHFKEQTSRPLSTNDVVGGQIVCPDEFGLYADPDQCDKYYECENSRSSVRLCADGLVYSEVKGDAGIPDPCESPYVVDCTSRSGLQEPSFFSDECPRLFGVFADPDPNVCDKYYTCINGVHTVNPCPIGLHFSEVTGNCNWKDQANRGACIGKPRDPSKFECAAQIPPIINGISLAHPRYPDPKDCVKFFICKEGVTLDLGQCELGQVFNHVSLTCDYPENVPECKDYYLGSEHYYDPALLETTGTAGRR